jgi:AraC-like DNA-binding protein
MPASRQSGTSPPSRLVASERSYAAAPSVDRHPYVQIVLPERGRLEMQIGGERGYAGGIRFALAPSEVEHRYWAEGPNRFLVLDLSPSLIAEVRRELDGPAMLPGEAFPVMGERLGALAVLLRAELARGGLAEPLIAESLGRYAGSVLLQPAPSVPGGASSPATRALASRTRDYLEASYLEPLTIGQIAAAVGSSASHMQRAFRAHYGVTIVAFVQARRLDRAKALLREGDHSVAEVGFAAGFHDQSYFTRLFTREVGLPPTRYRAAIRAGSDTHSR